jgi:predicted phage replisome organizer
LLSDVKWIKVYTDMASNKKIKRIRALPEGNNIILIWVFLLAQAGESNKSGALYLTDTIPFRAEDLAIEFDYEIAIIQLALITLERYSMIEVFEDIIYIKNWNEYQNIEGLEKIREQTRLRVEKFRDKPKLLSSNVTCNVTVTQGNATELELDKELDIDKKNNILSAEPTPYPQIQQLFNEMCTTLPKIKDIKGSRQKALNSRWKEYSDIEFWKSLFKTVHESNFLSGRDGNWTGCSFDWIIKPTNLQKIIEGNYKNKEGVAKGNQKKSSFSNFKNRDYDTKALEERLLNKSRGELM